MSNDIKIHNRFSHLNGAKSAKPAAQRNPIIEDDSKYIPEEFKKVARGMESQFAELMLKQMESTATLGEEDNSTASGIYKNWLNTERAKIMTDSAKKLGVQDLVLDEIYPKKFRNKHSYNHYQQMQQKKLEMIKRNRAAVQNANAENSTKENIQINRQQGIARAEENSHE